MLASYGSRAIRYYTYVWKWSSRYWGARISIAPMKAANLNVFLAACMQFVVAFKLSFIFDWLILITTTRRTSMDLSDESFLHLKVSIDESVFGKRTNYARRAACRPTLNERRCQIAHLHFGYISGDTSSGHNCLLFPVNCNIGNHNMLTITAAILTRLYSSISRHKKTTRCYRWWCYHGNLYYTWRKSGSLNCDNTCEAVNTHEVTGDRNTHTHTHTQHITIER